MIFWFLRVENHTCSGSVYYRAHHHFGIFSIHVSLRCFQTFLKIIKMHNKQKRAQAGSLGNPACNHLCPYLVAVKLPLLLSSFKIRSSFITANFKSNYKQAINNNKFICTYANHSGKRHGVTWSPP